MLDRSPELSDLSSLLNSRYHCTMYILLRTWSVISLSCISLSLYYIHSTKSSEMPFIYMHARHYMPSPVMNITYLKNKVMKISEDQDSNEQLSAMKPGFITRLSNSLWYNAVYCRICTKFPPNKTLTKKMALLEPEHHNCYITYIRKLPYLYHIDYMS